MTRGAGGLTAVVCCAVLAGTAASAQAPQVDPGTHPSARTHVETAGALQVWAARVHGVPRLLARRDGRTTVVPLPIDADTPFDLGPGPDGRPLLAAMADDRIRTYDLRARRVVGDVAAPSAVAPVLSVGGCRLAIDADDGEGLEFPGRGCLDGAPLRTSALIQADLARDRVVVAADLEGRAQLWVRAFAPGARTRVVRTLDLKDRCHAVITAPEVLGGRVVWLERRGCRPALTAYAMPLEGGRPRVLRGAAVPRVLRDVRVDVERDPKDCPDDPDHPQCYGGGGNP